MVISEVVPMCVKMPFSTMKAKAWGEDGLTVEMLPLMKAMLEDMVQKFWS